MHLVIHIVEYSKLAYSQFPFCRFIGTQLLSVACLNGRLVTKLRFNTVKDYVLLILAEPCQVLFGFWYKLDLKHHIYR